MFLSHLVITHKNKRSSCFRYTAFNDTVNIIYRWKRNQLMYFRSKYDKIFSTRFDFFAAKCSEIDYNYPLKLSKIIIVWCTPGQHKQHKNHKSSCSKILGNLSISLITGTEGSWKKWKVRLVTSSVRRNFNSAYSLKHSTWNNQNSKLMFAFVWHQDYLREHKDLWWKLEINKHGKGCWVFTQRLENHATEVTYLFATYIKWRERYLPPTRKEGRN